MELPERPVRSTWPAYIMIPQAPIFKGFGLGDKVSSHLSCGLVLDDKDLFLKAYRYIEAPNNENIKLFIVHNAKIKNKGLIWIFIILVIIIINFLKFNPNFIQ